MKEEIHHLIDARDRANEAIYELLEPINEWLGNDNFLEIDETEYEEDFLRIRYSDYDGDHCSLEIPWRFLEQEFDHKGFEAYLKDQREERRYVW
jgi:hypothetical protein